MTEKGILAVYDGDQQRMDRYISKSLEIMGENPIDPIYVTTPDELKCSVEDSGAGYNYVFVHESFIDRNEFKQILEEYQKAGNLFLKVTEENLDFYNSLSDEELALHIIHRFNICRDTLETMPAFDEHLEPLFFKVKEK